MNFAGRNSQTEIIHGHEVVTIRSSSGKASASFAVTFGGLGTSLKLNDHGKPREVIYQRPDFWTTDRDPGGLPFLFPVCGRHMFNGQLAKYQWNGAVYDMPLHGFSMRKRWMVQDLAPDRLVMLLTDDDLTRQSYPFEFNVTLDYRITDTGLLCFQTYENRGNVPMPFYAGFHPYFAADTLDTDQWEITGNWDRIGEYDETFASIRHWAPVPDKIDPVTAARKQHVIESSALRSIKLNKNGRQFVSMRLANEIDDASFPYLQMYRSNNDPFICLEPWMGLPNGLNEPSRIPCLAPGEMRQATIEIAV